MADKIRAFDWAATPLGPIEEWSETLTSTVNLVLATPQPTTLSWGEALIFFYNDATIPTLDRKHPSALGRSYREVFAEAWHLVGPDMEACYANGQTTIREDVPIPILRAALPKSTTGPTRSFPSMSKGASPGFWILTRTPLTRCSTPASETRPTHNSDNS